MVEEIPARLSAGDTIATWNPALTRAQQVRLTVLRSDGSKEERVAMNSGRARVREGERIVAVRAGECA